MSIKKVIFNVGVAHPLYNKEVDAEIISENTGYDGRCVYARTIAPVYYPRNEEGILLYKNGEFVGYKPSEAHEEIYEGYCELVKSIGETTIQITFSEEDIKELKSKCGTIENKQDLYNSVWEAITTFLEL